VHDLDGSLMRAVVVLEERFDCVVRGEVGLGGVALDQAYGGARLGQRDGTGCADAWRAGSARSVAEKKGAP